MYLKGRRAVARSNLVAGGGCSRLALGSSTSLRRLCTPPRRHRGQKDCQCAAQDRAWGWVEERVTCGVQGGTDILQEMVGKVKHDELNEL